MNITIFALQINNFDLLNEFLNACIMWNDFADIFHLIQNFSQSIFSIVEGPQTWPIFDFTSTLMMMALKVFHMHGRTDGRNGGGGATSFLPISNAAWMAAWQETKIKALKKPL